MKTIAITNQKGGVGKTTSAVNIAAGLYQLGEQILVVDMDPQANLTYSLGVQAHELGKTVYNVLQEELPVEDIMVDKKGLKLIPSSLDLARAETGLSRSVGRELLLKEALNPIEGFDYILIDCPPSLGLLTLNALGVAQEVYIPVQVEFLPLQGLSSLLDTIKEVKLRLNENLKVTRIIATRFHRGKNLHKEVVNNLKNHFGDKVFSTYIRENISLAEAPSRGETIFEYEPNSHGSEDYMNLSKEILERS